MNFLKRVWEKGKLRIYQFSIHPLSKHAQLRGMLRYVLFNSVIRFKEKLTYNWVHGLKFTVKRGEAGIVGNVYFGLNDFEDSGFVLHFLRPTDLFVDVGANLGHFTMLASGVTRCKSIAIEPVPSTFLRLRENIELNWLNDSVTLFNLGVGEKNGELYFSTDKGPMNRIVNKNYLSKVGIPVESLDNILSSYNPSVIKIDVEGFEYFVLQGARAILKNYTLKCIIIEINGSGNRYGKSDSEIINILESYGFHPLRYNPLTRSFTSSEHDTDKFNVLFIRDFEFVKGRCLSGKSFKVWDISV